MSASGASIVPKPTRRKRHGDLRRALVEAGLQAIEERGVPALTIRGLARRLRVSHAAPAHHFPDKLALLSAVAAEAFRRFGAALHEGARSGSTPLECLQRIGRAYVRFALDHPATFRVMFGRELAECPEASPELQQARSSAYAVLQETARAAAGAPAAGRIHAFTGWALVHGAALLYLDGALRPTLPAGSAGRAALEELVDSALTGGALPHTTSARPTSPRATRRVHATSDRTGPRERNDAEAKRPPRRTLRRRSR